MCPKRVVHAPPAQDVFSCDGTAVLNGIFGVPKKGKLVEGTNLPILRLILNAIASNAFQRITKADIRALPYHGQWSEIEVDDDERANVWSESDMTSAFCCFLLKPSWYTFQAINKPVPGSLAAAFHSSLAKETCRRSNSACHALGWQSACVLLQYFHRLLCFPWEQGLTPAERFGATCRYHERGTKTDRISCLLGRFQPNGPGAHLGVSLCYRDSHGCRRRSCSLGLLENPEPARQRSYKAR